MRASHSSRRGNLPLPPAHPEHTGVLVLAVLAAAAFCGWYIIVHDRPSDTKPLSVVETPLMPPETTDTSAELPGHQHYAVFGTADKPIQTAKP